MLRITIEERDDQVIFRVEGKLTGPWVIELERCWRSTRDRATGKSFGVDLDGVDFIDDPGKALLKEMASAGVQLIATGLMMRWTVQHIVSSHYMNSMEDTSEMAQKADRLTKVTDLPSVRKESSAGP